MHLKAAVQMRKALADACGQSMRTLARSPHSKKIYKRSERTLKNWDHFLRMIPSVNMKGTPAQMCAA
jgi:hypothetical protein